MMFSPQIRILEAIQKIGLVGDTERRRVPYLLGQIRLVLSERLVSEYDVEWFEANLSRVLKEFWGASGAYLTGRTSMVILKKSKPNHTAS